jgi:DNA mismatch endonuclease (patch repair protein)
MADAPRIRTPAPNVQLVQCNVVHRSRLNAPNSLVRSESAHVAIVVDRASRLAENPYPERISRMADLLTRAQRSALMSKIRGKDTRPELVVRRLVHAMGFRYRLHRRDLPGSPDLVFTSRRKIIFVHGCFWHRHQGCPDAFLPKTRPKFWATKLHRNVVRDTRVKRQLRGAGWQIMTVWECTTYGATSTLEQRLMKFLAP